MQTSETYEGYEIKFSERTETWYGYLGKDEVAEDKRLPELKKKLKAHKRRESKFEKVEVFRESHGYVAEESFLDGIVTSVSDGRCPWVTWKGAGYDGEDRREKRYNCRGLYLRTPANLKRRKMYEILKGEIKVLQGKQKKLLDGMEEFDPKQKGEDHGDE